MNVQNTRINQPTASITRSTLKIQELANHNEPNSELNDTAKEIIKELENIINKVSSRESKVKKYAKRSEFIKNVRYGIYNRLPDILRSRAYSKEKKQEIFGQYVFIDANKAFQDEKLQGNIRTIFEGLKLSAESINNINELLNKTNIQTGCVQKDKQLQRLSTFLERIKPSSDKRIETLDVNVLESDELQPYKPSDSNPFFSSTKPASSTQNQVSRSHNDSQSQNVNLHSPSQNDHHNDRPTYATPPRTDLCKMAESLTQERVKVQKEQVRVLENITKLEKNKTKLERELKIIKRELDVILNALPEKVQQKVQYQLSPLQRQKRSTHYPNDSSPLKTSQNLNSTPPTNRQTVFSPAANDNLISFFTSFLSPLRGTPTSPSSPITSRKIPMYHCSTPTNKTPSNPRVNRTLF